jgi:hypothetical protein
LDSDLNKFSKTPPEAFWNFALILILICFCRAQHPQQTFKSYPERDTYRFSLLVAHRMVKAAIAQPSPSPSPSKLIGAKLLVARAEQKAKGKRKAPAKATKATTKSNKATKAARAADEGGSDVEIVEDGTTIKCVSYTPATFMSLMLF